MKKVISVLTLALLGFSTSASAWQNLDLNFKNLVGGAGKGIGDQTFGNVIANMGNSVRYDNGALYAKGWNSGTAVATASGAWKSVATAAMGSQIKLNIKWSGCGC